MLLRFHGIVQRARDPNELDLIFFEKESHEKRILQTNRLSKHEDLNRYLEEYDNFDVEGSVLELKTEGGIIQRDLEYEILTVLQQDGLYVVRVLTGDRQPDYLICFDDKLEVVWTLAPDQSSDRSVVWMDIDWDKGRLWACDSLEMDWPIDIKTGRVLGQPIREGEPRYTEDRPFNRSFFMPPYKRGTRVVDIVAKKKERFYKLTSPLGRNVSQFLMRENPGRRPKHFSRSEWINYLKSKYSIPQAVEVSRFSSIDVPKGTRIRLGLANGNFPEKRGGMQIEILDKYPLNHIDSWSMGLEEIK